MSAPLLEDVLLVGRVAALRPTRASDALAVYPSLAGCEAILDWILWDGPSSVEELSERYGRWNRSGREGASYMLAICDKSGGPMLGCISVRFDETPTMGDLGYYVLTEHQGRGLATDAVRLMTHLCFEQLGAALVTAEVMVGNDPSARVLERAGYRREPMVPKLRPLEGAAATKADRPMWTFTVSQRAFLNSCEEIPAVDTRVRFSD